MKIPKTFIPEKNLEKKTAQLIESSQKKAGLDPFDVKEHYLKFINIRPGKEFTLENLQEHFKGVTYEQAMELIEYRKREKDRFLEGLADIS